MKFKQTLSYFTSWFLIFVVIGVCISILHLIKDIDTFNWIKVSSIIFWYGFSSILLWLLFKKYFIWLGDLIKTNLIFFFILCGGILGGAPADFFDITPKRYFGLREIYESNSGRFEADEPKAVAVNTYLYEWDKEKESVLIANLNKNSDIDFGGNSRHFLFWQTGYLKGFKIDHLDNTRNDSLEYQFLTIGLYSLLEFIINSCLNSLVPTTIVILLSAINRKRYFFNGSFEISEQIKKNQFIKLLTNKKRTKCIIYLESSDPLINDLKNLVQTRKQDYKIIGFQNQSDALTYITEKLNQKEPVSSPKFRPCS